MKLPENKNERIKILAMIVIGFISVIYAILQLVVLPVMESHKKNIKTLEEKRAEQEKMNRELRKVRTTQNDSSAVDEKVHAFSLHLAQPVLGTYLIGIQSGLEQLANTAGLRVNAASEIGFAEIPGKNKDGAKRAIKSYGVRMSGSGAYAHLLDMVRQLEESNPLLCISELTIIAQLLTPESHQINFSIEWPVLTESEKGADEQATPETPAPTPPATSAGEDGL